MLNLHNPGPYAMSQPLSATPGTGVRAESRLAHFPVALFATVMGVAGLSLAWLKAQNVAGIPADIGEILRWVASILYLVLIALYGMKVLRHPASVIADGAHPVKMNFFPAISIGLLLLAIAWSDPAPAVARWMLYLAAFAHLVFTIWALNRWLYHGRYKIEHANPAWFIPVVGNILVPIAGVKLVPTELNWFFFSIGLVFWLSLMAIMLNRLFFHDPLPARLMPTLFILIAPPAVGFISYVALTGVIDAFAQVMYFFALFLTLLLASNAWRFLRLPFFISAWAYAFPLAAMTIATFERAGHGGGRFYMGLGWLLLSILSIIVFVLVIRTLQAARAGHICVPE